MSGLRSALLIAADQYDDPMLDNLRSPRGDVEALAQVLGDEQIGEFAVWDQLVNEPAERVMKHVSRFLQQPEWPDLLLVYLSCHGVLSAKGDFYFATPETELHNPLGTGVDADFVKKAMRYSTAKSIVVILDCCHSGAFARGAITKGPVRDVHLERLEDAGSGRMILTATNEIEHAMEGEELVDLGTSPGRSVFTDVLVEGLRTGEADKDRNGKVTVDELYKWAYSRVIERTDRHRPMSFGELKGDVRIAHNPNRSPLPDEVLRLSRHDDAAVRQRAVAWLRDLSRKGDRAVKDAAQAELALLREDDDPTVAAAVRAPTRRRTARAPVPDDRAAPLVQRGDVSRHARRYPTALDNYDGALRLAPDSVDALVGRGDTLRSLHRYDEALDDLEQAIRLDPDGAAARLARAQVLTVRGLVDDALADLEAVLAVQPDSAEALVARGRVLMRVQPARWSAALSDFRRVLDFDALNVEAHVGMGLALSGMNEGERAQTHVDRARELDPTAADVITAAAVTFFRRGDRSRARRAIDEALARDDRNPEALLLSGRMCLDADDATAARSVFERALEIVEDDPAAHFGMGWVSLRGNDLRRALVELDAALSASDRLGEWPAAALVHCTRGECLLAMARPEDAVAAFTAALGQDSTLVPALAGRGRAHLELGRADLACVDLGQALAADPSDPEDVATLRSAALASLAGASDAGWPEELKQELERAREANERVICEAPVEGGWQDEQRDRLLAHITGTEELLCIGRCGWREDVRRHVVFVVSTQQLAWSHQKPRGAAKAARLRWRDVRDVKDVEPQGFRVVLQSGPRTDFVDVSGVGIGIASPGSSLDADAVRSLIRGLVA